MIKIFTQKFLLFFLLLTCLLYFSPTRAQSYTENFDNITLLAGNGWYTQNNSGPLGITSWFQGTSIASSGPFNAYVGAANAYIGANFNNTTGGTGVISNWLVTPNRTLRNGDVFSFYTRKPAILAGQTDYPDRLEVRMSTNGASTNVGTSAVATGDFTTLLLSVNPSLVQGGYPQAWTMYTVTISGLPAPTSGRIAFRYFVTAAGPTGTNSDYIGIDEVSYTPYVCPVLTVSPASLPGGTAGAAYSQSLSQTGALGAPNYAVTAGALPPGLTLSAGGSIAGTPTATGTFNFTVTVSDASGCSGSRPYSITVVCGPNPITFNPTLICSTAPYTLNATPAGGTFSGTGVSSGIFDPTAGNQTLTYDYTDPYGCAHSSSAAFTVVDGGVTSISPASQTICSGEAISNIVTSNTIAGAAYSWTRDNVATVTGIPATGSIGTITGSLVNTTSAPVTVTFNTTATVNGCISSQASAVLVNPQPVADAVASETICSGASITTVNPAGPVSGTVFNWTRNNTATVTGIAATGTGTISGSLVNTTNAPVIVTFTVTPTANGCTGIPVTFSVTVNPIPDAGALPVSQSVCSSTISPIVLGGNVAGTIFNWTRDNAASVTGIAASGSGDISGSLVNITNAPVTVTFTITPTANGCPGTPVTATVVSNPVPDVLASTTSQTVCSGTAITAIGLTGNVTGSAFNWTRDNTASVTGIAASGSGDISGSLVNTTNAPVTVTFTITPVANGCSGTPVTSTVTVNPAPAVTATPASQTVCSGAITPIVFSGAVAGAAYNWTRDNTTSATGIAASGSGDISGTLTNTTANPVTVTFTVIPTASGCPGSPVTATITVGAAPAITCPGNIVLSNVTGTCGAPATYTATATGIPAPAISYSFSGATTGSGSGTGSGSAFSVGITTITLTATNSCGTTNCSFTVTVNDTQNPVITCPAPVTVSCAGAVPAPDVAGVTATDNCSGVIVTHISDIISNQTCANRYTITRTYRATDAAGNTADCTQTITVNDQTAPVISCPANIITSTPIGSCNAVANFVVNATDNCGGAVTITTLPASGSVFPMGTTTVTATATDACGNSSTCTFTVTVNDGQLPVISTQPVNDAVCAEQDATFVVTATNVVSYQWQRFENNAWVNVNGANSASYTVPDASPAQNGTRYRVMLTGTCTTVYSNDVTLTVYTLPQPVINTPAEICLQDRTVQLSATPSGGTFSGTGVTGVTWNLEIPGAGANTIGYTYTDGNGCTVSTSKIIDLQTCNGRSSLLEVQAYPNPTSGRITVKALVTIASDWTIDVTDYTGRLVQRQQIPLRKGWNQFEVDLTGKVSGLYIISLGRGGGHKGEIKVLKQN